MAMSLKRSRSLGLPPTILSLLKDLQNSLNSAINPSWRTVRTVDDWNLAIVMESTELLDSYPWKWWKNVAGVVDINNVKIELVDILHFSLSGAMQLEWQRRGAAPSAALEHAADVGQPFRPQSGNATATVQGYLFLPLSNTENAIASFRNLIMLANASRFTLITELVVAAAEDLDFNLVGYYVAKHTLNYIRQLSGYKDGTYVKVNNGVEDNALLHSCIRTVSVMETVDADQYATAWNRIISAVNDAFQVPEKHRRDVRSWLEFQNDDANRPHSGLAKVMDTEPTAAPPAQRVL